MNIQAMGDIREMSFQNVVDQILKPNNVNLGGFPEDIFQKLTEEEKEKLICNICFMIVNDPRQCQNKHMFCNTCIFAWTLTYGENSQKCPMCRVDQTDYSECREVSRLLQDKMVKCPEDKCTFKAPLKVFLMHGHGKSRFSNTHVDLEKLRPQRPDGSRLLVLPALNMTGDTRRDTMRNQLQQGRLMIQQMMMLLHLEMQLRHQAVTSFQQATDPTTRLNRLDEVMALNEQLNEVGTVLSTMFNSPINSIIAANRIMQGNNTSRRSSRPFEWETPLGSSRRQEADDDDSDSSISSDESTVISTARRNLDVEHRTLNRRSNGAPSSRITDNESRSDPAFGRVEIGESLLRSMPDRNTADSGDIPVINEGRHLSDYSQANIATASTVTTEIHPRVLLGRNQMARREVAPRQSDTNAASTQRLTSAGTRRVGLATTVNSRNQTLPGVSNASATVQESSSQNSSLPNSVARQQGNSSITPSRPTETLNPNAANQATLPRQHTSGPPGAIGGSVSTIQRSLTPRPPSAQPSEANEPDDNQNSLPRGSTAYREVQQMMNSHQPDRNTPARTESSNNSGPNTLSRPTVANTLGRSRNDTQRTPGGQVSTSVLATRDTGNRATISNSSNIQNAATPRYQERNRPSLLTADSANLSGSVTPRQNNNNSSRIASESNPSSNSFGSLERVSIETSNTVSNTTRRNVGTRRKTNNLQRATERRPTLTDQSTRNANTVQVNSRNIGVRQQNRPQANPTTNASTQRSQVSHEGQSTTPRKPSTNGGTVPKIRNSLHPSTSTQGTGASRGGSNNGRMTLYRPRRRSEIQEDLRRFRNEDG